MGLSFFAFGEETMGTEAAVQEDTPAVTPAVQPKKQKAKQAKEVAPDPYVVSPAEAINQSRMSIGDFARQNITVRCFPNTTKEMLEQEIYWAHVSRLMHSGDAISVLSDDLRDYFEGIVIDAGAKWARVAILRHYELDGRGQRTMAEYKAEYCNPVHKYRVLRVADNEVMAKGFNSMEVAEAWVKNRQKQDLE